MQRRLLIAIPVVIILLYLLSVALLQLIDTSQYKSTLENSVQKTTGRTLRIDGELETSFWLGPTITLSNISLSNSPESAEKKMLHAGVIHADLALFPLLFGKVVVNDLRVHDARLFLEKDHKNWDFGKEDSTETSELPHIKELTVTNSIIRYKNGNAIKDFSIHNAEIRTKNPTEIAIDVKGIYQEQPFTITGTSDNPHHFLDETFHTDLTFFTPRYKELNLALDIRRFPSNTSFWDIKIDADHIALGSDENTTKNQKIFSKKPLPIDFFKDTDADISVEARYATIGTLPLQNLNIHGNLRSGVLNIPHITANTLNGTLNADIILDATQKPPRLATNLLGTQLHPGEILSDPKAGKTFTGGVTNTAFRGDSRGISSYALASNLAGEARFFMNHAVYDKSIQFGNIQSLFNMFTLRKQNTRVTLNCFIGDFSIKNGIAKSQTLIMDSEDTVVYGDGIINLPRETVSITFDPKSKSIGLADFVSPMELRGSLTNFSMKPQNKGVAKNTGKAFLGIATGIGLVGAAAANLAVNKAGSDYTNPCVAQ